MKLQNVTLMALMATAMLVTIAAEAGDRSERLGACMMDRISREEKQKLQLWMYAQVSLNPAVARYSSISSKQREEIDRDFARTLQRLLTESCADEARAAIMRESATGLTDAFSIIGVVAGEDLFLAPEVSAGAETFAQYIDINALQRDLKLVEE